jgi:hypothetical protein
VRDCFVEFLSSTPQSDQNILPVPGQVFIPAVSHMKIANVQVGTIHRNVRIALQFSYQFAIFISVCNFHISLQFLHFGVSLYWGVFNILKITTTTHNGIVCISFYSKSANSNPPIYIYAKRGQSQLSNGIRVWGSWTESS